LNGGRLLSFRGVCDAGGAGGRGQAVGILEGVARQPGPNSMVEHRYNGDTLIAAHERLQVLRHYDEMFCQSMVAGQQFRRPLANAT
jgi:hypothetical protein